MKCLAVAAVLALAVAGPSAQQPIQPIQPVQPPEPQATPPAPLFRSGASLVSINVTVTDGKQFVPGLQPHDFAVYEDGVQQRVQFFEARNVPLDLMLLIDGSSSMRDKMPIVHEAAVNFIRTLRDGDRGAVVVFNDGVQIVQELTGDRGVLEKAIESTQARGGTALNNAIYIAIKQLGRGARSSEAVRRQAVAVLSDGQDTASLLSFDDVLGQARRGGVSIYTIALKSPQHATSPDGRRYFSESDFAMRALARETGAQAFFVEKIGELKGIYGEIASELASQYSIGYAPTNTRSDGRFRRIVVRVTSRPNLKPRARAGYLAEGNISSAAAMPPGGR